MNLTIQTAENGFIIYINEDIKYIATTEENVIEFVKDFLFSPEVQELSDPPF